MSTNKRVLDYFVWYAGKGCFGHHAFNNQDDANRFARRVQRLGYNVELKRYFSDTNVQQIEIESEQQS